jgi:hypothetical protein
MYEYDLMLLKILTKNKKDTFQMFNNTQKNYNNFMHLFATATSKKN